MLIAKYEEIYPPELKDYVVLCDNAYRKEEILEMEASIILKLNFNLSWPTPFCFLEQLAVRIGMNDRLTTFCRYILEVGMLDV